MKKTVTVIQYIFVIQQIKSIQEINKTLGKNHISAIHIMVGKKDLSNMQLALLEDACLKN